MLFMDVHRIRSLIRVNHEQIDLSFNRQVTVESGQPTLSNKEHHIAVCND